MIGPGNLLYGSRLPLPNKKSDYLVYCRSALSVLESYTESHPDCEQGVFLLGGVLRELLEELDLVDSIRTIIYDRMLEVIDGLSEHMFQSGYDLIHLHQRRAVLNYYISFLKEEQARLPRR